jgi:hypothetical protein
VCPAREADLTFARGHLADFASVWSEVDAWMARR